MLIWFPQKQTLTWGFECKKNIWNTIPGNSGKGMGKWDKKEVKDDKVCLIKEIIAVHSRDSRLLESTERYCRTHLSIIPTEGPELRCISANTSCVCWGLTLGILTAICPVTGPPILQGPEEPFGESWKCLPKQLWELVEVNTERMYVGHPRHPWCHLSVTHKWIAELWNERDVQIIRNQVLSTGGSATAYLV